VRHWQIHHRNEQPDVALQRQAAGVKALPIDFPIWPWPVAVVTLKNRTVNPIVNVFVDHVRTFFAELRQRIDRQQWHGPTRRPS
jgi:hypothetical protein